MVRGPTGRKYKTREEIGGLAVKTSGSQDILEFLMLSFRADARRTSALVTEWSQTIYESLSIHRSGVPIACSNGGSLNYRDGSSHRPGIGDHHDGLVRRARGVGIGARWARIQHGEVSEPLHAAHLCIRDGDYYDSSIPGLGFSIKGFIDGGTINLVNLIGSDGSNTMLNEIHQASSKMWTKEFCVTL